MVQEYPILPDRPRPKDKPYLTTRENQVLELLLVGKSKKQISASLGITVNTVHTHISAIYRHHRVESHVELLARHLKSVVSREVQVPDGTSPAAPSADGVAPRPPA